MMSRHIERNYRNELFFEIPYIENYKRYRTKVKNFPKRMEIELIMGFG